MTPNLRPATAKQQAVIDFLSEYQAREGMPPTIREIADRFGYASLNSVRDILRTLAEKKLVTRTAHGSRCWRTAQATAALERVGCQLFYAARDAGGAVS